MELSSAFSLSSCGQDVDLINQVLEVEGYNVDSAIFAVSQVNEVEGPGKSVEWVSWCLRTLSRSAPSSATGTAVAGARCLLPPQPFCAQECH